MFIYIFIYVITFVWNHVRTQQKIRKKDIDKHTNGVCNKGVSAVPIRLEQFYWYNQIIMSLWYVYVKSMFSVVLFKQILCKNYSFFSLSFVSRSGWGCPSLTLVPIKSKKPKQQFICTCFPCFVFSSFNCFFPFSDSYNSHFIFLFCLFYLSVLFNYRYCFFRLFSPLYFYFTVKMNAKKAHTKRRKNSGSVQNNQNQKSISKYWWWTIK